MPLSPRTSSARARESDSLAQLVARAASGDREAFADLYDGTSCRVFGLVLRIVRDRAQAEEVTQEVYLQVWRTAARYDARKGSAISWLLMLAHRRSVDRVRSSEVVRRSDARYYLWAYQPEPDSDSTAEAFELSAESARLGPALGKLSPIQREAIELAYFGGWTYREVAGITGVAAGTAKGRIRDGLIRLRATLEDAA